ncbi:MAG: carboxypeptidase-like regulatory domain-containing protein [Nitrospirae bacterium]|nr:carboxypeptidase-like regulatory domain-containing protein [Nitrospirota bacterium]
MKLFHLLDCKYPKGFLSSTKHLLPSLVMAVGVLGWMSTVFGYEVAEVSNGGTIKGRVTLSGKPPDPKAFNLVTYPDPEYCGKISNGHGWRLLRDFVVAEDGALQGVVVFLEDVKVGKTFSLSIPRIEARNCQFLPFTTVIRSGHGVEVVNMDPVMHDIQAYETSRKNGTRVLFNSPLPFNPRHDRRDLHATHGHKPGRSLVQQFQLNKGRKTFVMQCGFHAYMESWAFAVDNPYYGFTDSKGGFVIEDIPPGSYDVRAWHPSVKKEIRTHVVVNPNETLTIHFDLPSPQRRRTSHTVMRPPRFDLEALGRPLHIDPFLERQ